MSIHRRRLAAAYWFARTHQDVANTIFDLGQTYERESHICEDDYWG